MTYKPSPMASPGRRPPSIARVQMEANSCECDFDSDIRTLALCVLLERLDERRAAPGHGPRGWSGVQRWGAGDTGDTEAYIWTLFQ
jgi:hypothetical protein